MNNFNNCTEIDKIKSQLERADVQKKSLIRNIFREYELYLNLVRDLLCSSVEKGLNEICSDPSNRNIFLNSNEFFCFFEKKIIKLIYTKLPLITLEQLKIQKIEKNINMDFDFNGLCKSLKIKDHQKGKLTFEDISKFEEPMQFQINGDISNTSKYYYAENYEKLGSLDLDNNDHFNFLSDNYIIENIGTEKQSIPPLLELIEEVKLDKTRHFENHNVNQVVISPKNSSLNKFNLIDKSLENLLLNLSYKINLELFKSNLIKKMISQDSFEYLMSQKFMIKHPHPFVINFDFNINQSSSNGDNLPSIIFFKISTVELEFNNLNLSIQRNKINELKNQFQRLIKKETYWRQKEITLNKIR